jgi:hypothetical protein
LEEKNIINFKSWFETAELISQIINAKGLIFFFTFNKKTFGAPEESRLVFSKLKDPDDNDTTNWNGANFIAYNMQDALSGIETSCMFNDKDIKGIKVIDQKQISKLLEKDRKK